MNIPCRWCGKEFPSDEKYWTKGDRVCKCCWNEYHRLRNRDVYRYTKHGITREGYLSLSASQGDVCAICDEPETHLNTNGSGEVANLSIDHCHATGKVRGLLCRNCNRGLGMFGDDPATLRAALAYLDREPGAALR